MRAYLDAGADVGFIEAPQSIEELIAIPKIFKKPMLANMLSGGLTPILSAQELETLGFRIVVCPVESLMVTAHAIRKLTKSLLDTGRVDQLSLEAGSFSDLKEILDLVGVMGLRERLEVKSP